MKKNICIIGAGVVGKAVGVGLSHEGHHVVFVDKNKDTVDLMRSYLYEAYLDSEVDYDKLDSDVYFLTVQTPTIKNGQVNKTYLYQAAQLLAHKLQNSKKYFVVVVKSTVPIGTTRKIARYIAMHGKKKIKVDFGICMNPEYLRQDTALEDFEKPTVTVIGCIDKRSGDVLEEVFSRFHAPIIRTTLEEAEMQKYVHNAFNACKIAFFNEMRVACKKFNVNADGIFPIVAKSCEGIFSSSYGMKNKGAYAGACLPKDVAALHALLKRHDSLRDLISAVITSNEKYKELCK